jgi:hypothetical protein
MPTACPTVTTTYTISVVDGGCTLSDAVTITVLPPSNDNCVNAIDIDFSDYGFFSALNCNPLSGSNVASTLEPGEPTMCVTQDNSVWYTFTTPTCGAAAYYAEMSTDNNGTNYDTAIDLFYSANGTCDFSQFVSVACNDDNNTGGCDGSSSVGGFSSTSYVTGSLVNGGTYYLRVDGFGSAVGNFGITMQLHPVAPTLVPGPLATTQITASWPSASPNHYDLYWKQTSQSGYAALTNISTTSHTIQYLMPNTSYSVQYKSVCIPVVEKYYSPVSMLTTAPSSCVAPDPVVCVSATNTTITIGWTPAGAALHYKIFYRLVGQNGYSVINNVPNTQNQYTFSGLQQGTAYEFWVRTVCSLSNPTENITSAHYFCSTTGTPRLADDTQKFDDYSYELDGVTYTNWDPADLLLDALTDGYAIAHVEVSEGQLMIGGEGSVSVQSMNIYPNPATSEATVDVRMVLSGEVSIRVYDVQGKLVESYLVMAEGEQFTYTLSLENLSAGMYNVVVESGDEKQTSKLAVVR